MKAMCGLCGEIAFGSEASPDALWRMMEQLKPRGPDAAGVFVQQNIGLGHRRLSILDLSANAQQPMVDPALGLVGAFNGCIYNFRELRQELIGAGYKFFSDGDTEVLLKAYSAWGPRCVERFHGMFAFAIAERDSGRVVLGRDRLGIKPLYYADTARGLRFASSLPALLAPGGVDKSIDPAALHHYMSWHAVVPAPMTLLKGVRKLPRATLMTIEPDGTRREEVYWTFSVGTRPQDRRISAEEWREQLTDTLTTAVRRRMVADVPVGILLSGGLDSSLLVALLAENGQTDLHTFAVGFETVGDVCGDEFYYSDRVAKEFGTEHHKLSVDAGATFDALPGTIAAMSEPMMSHDSIGFYLLSEQVSKHVKVVQSGQGADEVFAGYHWHQALRHSNDVSADYARLYFDRDHAEMAEALNPALMNGDYSFEYIDKFFGRCKGDRPLDKVLQLDTEIMLVDDPVKRVDNMTMAWGLEARVPFLDHEVVELAARMPADLKVNEDAGKRILKDAARDFLPAEIIDRPKGYFPVPALKYIRGPFLDFARDVLNDQRCRDRALFNRDYIDRLLADPEGELTPKGHSKLWQVAVLESWMQTHGI